MKIIGFDSWTQGKKHFFRISKKIIDSGNEFKVIHTGSWGNDKFVPKIFKENSVDFIDISNYNNSVNQFLKSEKPDVVVFLSTLTLTHRACIRLCKFYGIKTIHLNHGVLSTWVNTVNVVEFKIKKSQYLFFLLKRIFKMIRFNLPNYISSLTTTNSPISDYISLISELYYMSIGKANGLAGFRTAPSDANTDINLTYTNSDKNLISKIFICKKIKVVGISDIFDLKNQFNNPPKTISSNSKYVLYIASNLIMGGLVFKNNKHFIEHIKFINDRLNQKNIKLLIKLHPSLLNETDIQFFLNSNNIVQIDNEELISFIKGAEYIIAEPSTLTIIPMMLNKIIKVPNFDNFKNLKKTEFFLTYPNIQISNNYDDLVGTQISNILPNTDWLTSQIGEVDSLKFDENVVKEILNE